MSEKPITNPSIPYVGPLQGNLAPGKFVRILGCASPVGKGFSCNLQSGLSSYDDIVLQVLVRVEEGTIILNSQQHGGWGEALTLSNLQINRGQQFEILVICEPTVFKIGINGQHLCEFPHKVPYYKATYIKIEGDLSVSHISVENQPQAPPMDKPNSPPPPYPAPMLQSVYSQPPYPPPGTQPTAQPPYPPVGFQQNLPSQSPYPVSGPQSITAPPPYAVPGHQQTVPSQTPVPLNSAPQTILYPSGGYATTPMIQHQSNTAALNATPREYPFWNRSYGYRGNRKMAFIIAGIMAVMMLIFLIVFFTIFFKQKNAMDERWDEAQKKHDEMWDDAQKKHEEFRRKHFGNDW